jgi:hypothetical protein
VLSTEFDELVVADNGRQSIFLFNASGALLKAFGDGFFTGVALYGGTLFAQDRTDHRCVVIQ